ncbi:Cytochrome b-c1 complex subunit 8, mitochondrial [Rhodotorula toruloides]
MLSSSSLAKTAVVRIGSSYFAVNSQVTQACSAAPGRGREDVLRLPLPPSWWCRDDCYNSALDGPTLTMRASSAVHSGMPTGNKYMGWWGDMGGPTQKGISQYVVSPFRQAPMRGAFSHYLHNGVRRLGQQAVYFVVPFAAAYGILQWAIKDNHLRNSKHGQAQGLFP